MERSEAKTRGLKRYKTGRPCKVGHLEERNTSDGQCLACSRLKVRTWQKANPETHRQNRRQWRSRYPEKVKASLQRQYQRDPGKYKLSAKDYEQAKRQATIPLSREQKNEMLCIYRACPAGYHVDHIYPLRGENSCGLHVPWNLQHLPAAENIAKSNKLPD